MCDMLDCLGKPGIRIACHEVPRVALACQFTFKPPVHVVADVFAVAETVLDERDFVTCEKVKVGSAVRGERGEFR